jgi:hypothetical protein
MVVSGNCANCANKSSKLIFKYSFFLMSKEKSTRERDGGDAVVSLDDHHERCWTRLRHRWCVADLAKWLAAGRY